MLRQNSLRPCASVSTPPRVRSSLASIWSRPCSISLTAVSRSSSAASISRACSSSSACWADRSANAFSASILPASASACAARAAARCFRVAALACSIARRVIESLPFRFTSAPLLASVRSSAAMSFRCCSVAPSPPRNESDETSDDRRECSSSSSVRSRFSLSSSFSFRWRVCCSSFRARSPRSRSSRRDRTSPLAAAAASFRKPCWTSSSRAAAAFPSVRLTISRPCCSICACACCSWPRSVRTASWPCALELETSARSSTLCDLASSTLARSSMSLSASRRRSCPFSAWGARGGVPGPVRPPGRRGPPRSGVQLGTRWGRGVFPEGGVDQEGREGGARRWPAPAPKGARWTHPCLLELAAQVHDGAAHQAPLAVRALHPAPGRPAPRPSGDFMNPLNRSVNQNFV